MKRIVPVAGFLAFAAAPAVAQVAYDPVWLGQSAVGQSAMDNARENTRNTARKSTTTRTPAKRTAATVLSPAERKRLEAEYTVRVKRDGQASANAWAQAMGRKYRNR